MYKKIFISLVLIASCLFLYFSAIADQDAAQQHYTKGRIFYEKGDYVRAEMEFEEALKASRAAKDGHYKKGVELYEKGEYKQAEQEFELAIKARQSENDQHYKRGLVLYQQGKYKEAQEAFRKAINTIKKTQVVSQTRQIKPIAKTGEYRISNGDLLIIKVWQNPDLQDEVIVRPDGMISFPLIGDVQATGLTISGFREDVTLRLKEFIKYPQVSVSIKNFGGKRVIILGQVKSPGVYSLTGRQTVLEGIGLAGGFTEHAVEKSVMLIKGGFANPEPRRLDLNKALKKAQIGDNVVLESEDMIYVPRKFIKDVNYFLDQFLNPIAHGLFIKDQLRDF